MLVLVGGNIRWHPWLNDVIQPGTPPDLTGQFVPGNIVHVRVEVTGNTYSVYLDGSATPNATYTTAAYPTGRVGLYDFSSQSFDDVQLFAEGVYHVVTGNATDDTAILDGFTIMGGNTDGDFPNSSGGGMFNEGGSPTVTKGARQNK